MKDRTKEKILEITDKLDAGVRAIGGVVVVAGILLMIVGGWIVDVGGGDSRGPRT